MEKNEGNTGEALRQAQGPQKSQTNSVVPAQQGGDPEALEGRGGESLPLGSAVPSSPTPSNGGPAPRNAPQLSWEEQKKLEAEKRKKEKTLAALEQQLADLEQKKSDLENRLADPAVYSNGEKAKAVQREIEEVSVKIEEVTEQWMLASE